MSLKNINEGNVLRDGALLFGGLLCCLLYAANGSGLTLPLAAVMLLAGGALVFWCARCYTLQKETAELYLLLFLLPALLYALTLPVTPDELPVTGLLTYGNGRTFARLFSLPAFWLGRLVGMSAPACVTLARVAHVLGCSAVLTFAVAVIPYGKSIAACITLLPACMGGFACASPNSSTLAFSMAFIALALRLAYTKDAYVMSVRYRAALILCCTLMLLCDISCLPLLVFLFMIPRERFGSKKQTAVTLLLLAAGIAAAVLAWALLPAAAHATVLSADPAAQLQHMLRHPIAFLGSCVNTAFAEGGHLIAQLTALDGTHWGSSFQLLWPVTAALLICMFYAFYFDAGLSSRRKYVLRSIGGALVLYLLCEAANCYLHGTAVGETLISGLAANMLLPCALPAVLFVKRLFKHPAAPQKNLNLVLLTLALCNTVSVLLVYLAIH